MRTLQLPVALLLSLLAACSSPPRAPEATGPSASAAAVLALPGEVLNPDVRQDTIQQTICVPGYTATVRPSTSFTNGVKLKLLRENGLPDAVAKEYELDHHLPLALGGHPRNLKNLVLQPWEGAGGAKAKDRLERRLQRLVCSGNLLLEDGRRAIWYDWQAAFQRYVVAN